MCTRAHESLENEPVRRALRALTESALRLHGVAVNGDCYPDMRMGLCTLL